MFVRLLLLFTIVPLVELWLLLVLADATSWKFSLALVLVTGIVGAALARHQGIRCWQRVQTELAAGRLPGDPLMDGMMILLAGALLVTPGILTDVFGFSLLLPPVRALGRRLLRRRFQTTIHVVPPDGWPSPDAPQHDKIIDTRVIDSPPDDRP